MSEFHDLPHEERQRQLRQYLKNPNKDLEAAVLAPLRTPDERGLYTSKLGEHSLFNGSNFGRDSIETAEDLLEIDPEIARQTILMHVMFQGVEDDPLFSESKIGKAFHEHRERKDPDGNDYPDSIQKIITKLRENKCWASPNSSDESLTYYGSVDATPLFVRLVKKYVDKYGEAILDEEVVGLDGKTKTVANAIALAADFMSDEYRRAKVGKDPIGLYVWERTNTGGDATKPKEKGGLESQAWKDSPYAYLALRPDTKDGFEIANYGGGVASAEVQGYVYDALKNAVLLLRNRGATKEQVSQWRSTARELRRTTVRRLIEDNENFIAQGMDYDDAGRPRLLATHTTNALTLLDSDLILDVLNDPQENDAGKRLLKMTIGRMVMSALSPDFITGPGLRERSLRHDFPEFVDYHGSRVSWAKSTLDVANGFWGQGYRKEATELYAAIVARTIATAGNFYEFDRIEQGGEAAEANFYLRDSAQFDFENGEAGLPESYQAWTATAFLKAVRRLRKYIAAPALQT